MCIYIYIYICIYIYIFTGTDVARGLYIYMKIHKLIQAVYIYVYCILTGTDVARGIRGDHITSGACVFCLSVCERMRTYMLTHAEVYRRRTLMRMLTWPHMLTYDVC